jgi:amidase
MEKYLERLGPDSPIGSIEEAGIFAADGFFGFVAALPGVAESIANPDVPPDLSSFFAARAEMLAVFEQVMDENDLDGLFFPQMSAPVADLFSDDA